MLKPWAFEKGKRIIDVSSSDLSFPDNLMLEKLEPSQVVTTVEQKPVSEDDMR